MRDEIWEHFNDVTFYIRLGCDIFKILINSLTVCFGVYTIFCGSHSFHGILRLYGLCYVNIYLVILQLKAILYQRRQVVQFTANLPDSSKEEKLDVVRNMFKSAIEYTFTRRSITTTGKTNNNV
jgi:hypothetical protein